MDKKDSADYGEADIEAKAMTNAANCPGATPTLPRDASVPAEGTTETNIAVNIREKAERSSKN